VTPRIVVLSAPSGGGKTTIAKAVRETYPEKFGFSVSATTRRPRPGEQDGVDYYFWDRKRFEDEIKAGKFLEYAEYAGQLYGTLKAEVDRIRSSGRHVLLDIEVEGADQIKRLEKDALRLFILPTDPTVWFDRWQGRRTESPIEVRKRLERAVEELTKGAHFNRIVANDDLEEAVAEVVQAADGAGWEGNQRKIMNSLVLFDRYRDFVSDRMQELNKAIHSSKG
jgi:guanylate kinase